MIKIDYDKQLHKWNIWNMGPPQTLIMKAQLVSIKVPCELVVDDPPHGYLVVSGIVTSDGDLAVIRKG